MARADTCTLLALDRYATIMGIDPAHFNGAYSAALQPVGAKCSDIWWQYAWQSADRVAREDLAHEIGMAEEEIANLVGYWPGPKWIVDEVHPYPRPYRREYTAYGQNVRGLGKSIQTRYAKIIEPGPRETSAIGTASTVALTLEYVDLDGDGLDESARIVLPTTLTDIREVHTYFHDHGGDCEWEIKPPRDISIAGGSVTIVFWAWQFIDPDLWETLNTATARTAIDFLVPANLVTEVDVVREFSDDTVLSARFYWEPEGYHSLTTFCSVCGGTGCAICGLTTQDGCLHIRDVHRGIVVPTAGTYSQDTDAWSAAEWTQCREPDQVKVWYRAGDLDQRYLDGDRWDPLSHYWAQIIAWIATARLERPICACANQIALFSDLRIDLARSDRDGPTFTVSEDDLANPLGTRKGEVMAWRRMRNLIDRRNRVAVV